MRFSCIAVATLAVTSTSLAAPLKRDLLGSISSAVNGVINSNATLSGIAGAVTQSIENPQLTAARASVIKGLSDTQTSLSSIDSQATTTGNSAVRSLVATGQSGLSSARTAIDSIGQAIISGTKPSVADQKTVAVGIKDVRNAVNQMAAAITHPDATLTNDLATAQSNVQTLGSAGQNVLSASGLTFADLGLPDNFATS